ncbi:Hvo_1808 family surface protein [Halomicrococcus sp. NG-SE-24]|uniref:Hvo_1808 family surface protein n=1 Tax=Halomicrococcus sp. NG-SE-24 TaxID=3436928 RepID=UPI003D9833E2
MHGVGARNLGVLLVAVAVVLVAPGGVVGTGGSDATGAQDVKKQSDPENDVVGWEDGYWYDESIAVDQSDGLTEAERRAYVGRAMARVERLRGQEFQERVELKVLSRQQYRRIVRAQADAEFGPAQRAWENQVWEALFAVNESTDAAGEMVQLRQERIAGFYLPGTNDIYVIAESEDRPVVDNATLIHELTHALQDQQVGLSSPSLRAQTMDGRRGVDGLVEGEAMYVEKLYEHRCRSGWECVTTPGPDPPEAPYEGGPLPDYNLAMQVATIQPYSDGPPYVAARIGANETDGTDGNASEKNWSRLDYRRPPFGSEQVIDPATDADPPPTLRLGEQATDGWRLYGKRGENGSQTVGEAGIYTMFWYQGRAYDNQVIPWREFDTADGPLDEFNYTSEPSDGWGNDRLWPYHDGEKRGYVWRTTWDTDEDAVEFERAYRELLAGQNATRVGRNTWVVRRGGFEDAFHVVRDGKRVTIVNGPTVESLTEIRPSIEIRAAQDGCDCGQ